jgi:hypothetical protein
MPYDEPLSGEGSGLGTVWDEICFQVQNGHSFYWDAYVATMDSYLQGYLQERSQAEKDEIMSDAADDELIDVLRNALLIRAADYEYGQDTAPITTETISGGEIQALNAAAMTALEREASRVPDGLPRSSIAVLYLARWGLENLQPQFGFIARNNDVMEVILLSMERQAERDPEGVVRELAVGEAGEVLLRPSDLGPGLDSAASAVLWELARLAEKYSPATSGD